MNYSCTAGAASAAAAACDLPPLMPYPLAMSDHTAGADSAAVAVADRGPCMGAVAPLPRQRPMQKQPLAPPVCVRVHMCVTEGSKGFFITRSTCRCECIHKHCMPCSHMHTYTHAHTCSHTHMLTHTQILQCHALTCTCSSIPSLRFHNCMNIFSCSHMHLLLYPFRFVSIAA